MALSPPPPPRQGLHRRPHGVSNRHPAVDPSRPPPLQQPCHLSYCEARRLPTKRRPSGLTMRQVAREASRSPLRASSCLRIFPTHPPLDVEYRAPLLFPHGVPRLRSHRLALRPSPGRLRDLVLHLHGWGLGCVPAPALPNERARLHQPGGQRHQPALQHRRHPQRGVALHTRGPHGVAPDLGGHRRHPSRGPHRRRPPGALPARPARLQALRGRGAAVHRRPNGRGPDPPRPFRRW